MQRLVRRILYVVAIIATLYHIYLVFHPYTPISYLYRIGIFDLVQLQRATHMTPPRPERRGFYAGV